MFDQQLAELLVSADLRHHVSCWSLCLPLLDKRTTAADRFFLAYWACASSRLRSAEQGVAFNSVTSIALRCAVGWPHRPIAIDADGRRLGPHAVSRFGLDLASGPARDLARRVAFSCRARGSRVSSMTPSMTAVVVSAQCHDQTAHRQFAVREVAYLAARRPIFMHGVQNRIRIPRVYSPILCARYLIPFARTRRTLLVLLSARCCTVPWRVRDILLSGRR